MAKKGKKTKGEGLGRSGVIEEITTRESEELARVDVRHGPKPKKDKDGMTIGPYPDTSSVKVPKERARGLKTGQKVEVGITLPKDGATRVRV